MGSKNKPIDEINLDVVVGIDIENISLILFKSGFMSFLFIFVLNIHVHHKYYYLKRIS